jgi:hypothetical protein
VLRERQRREWRKELREAALEAVLYRERIEALERRLVEQAEQFEQERAALRATIVKLLSDK